MAGNTTFQVKITVLKAPFSAKNAQIGSKQSTTETLQVPQNHIPHFGATLGKSVSWVASIRTAGNASEDEFSSILSSDIQLLNWLNKSSIE
jgi:hypothetical protein